MSKQQKQQQLSRHCHDDGRARSGEAVIRRRNVPSRRRRDGLMRYTHNKTSQNGEDGILHHLFEHVLPPALPAQASPSSTTDMDGTGCPTLVSSSSSSSTSVLGVVDHSRQESRHGQRHRRLRWCVDVGAWDGMHWSNTHSLLTACSSHLTKEEKNQNSLPSINNTISSASANCKILSGWKGVLIEADLEKFQQLEALHTPLGNTCLHTTVSGQKGSPQSLAFLLQQQREQQQQQQQQQSFSPSLDGNVSCSFDDGFPLLLLPFDFDFLCIDIDGMDYWVLYNLLVDSPFRPQVICIEFNPTMPSDLIYIPPSPPPFCDNDDGDDASAWTTGHHQYHHGASLAALVELCADHDYVLIETTLYNAFFVPQRIYQQYLTNLVPDTSMEALHETTMGTTLYQLYNGTLKVWGCQKLLWHRIPVSVINIMFCRTGDK